MKIRRARIDDADKAANLICLAWEEVANVMAGSKNKKEVHDVIEKFYKQRKNILSYQYADVAENEGKVVGLLLSFPADFFPRLNKPIEKELPSIYKASSLRYKNRVIPMLQTKEAKQGEYYVDSLAVDPKYRATGIGSCLLEIAKQKSLTYGYKKMSLIVKTNNKSAFKLYKKKGYSVRGKLQMAGNNYLSMVKTISKKKKPTK